ncbi:MAG: ImmA/IrrE family metallo-endopeptidase [Microbacterium sp.]|uniref:ImmA/IrrE family metallo-endopeptidase n=1 Tax=Microbacterium sp. TaxID=51671 RepID=UPI003F811167
MPPTAGFVKKHVTDLAYQTRDELGLSPFDRLDPLVLADYLEIPVLRLSEFQMDNPEASEYFLSRDPGAFSGLTVFHGTGRIILHNDAHSPARQASNICHELGHGLLLHDPTPAVDGSGCREWDQVMEDQAQWMAGALLIHEVGLVTALRRGNDVRDIARRYGASEDMVSWRINMTGAHRRARQAARR